MAILTFQKPEVVTVLEADEKHGIFELRPLQPGFGLTVGNALRRVLLSSLEGYAVTSIKIKNVDQEFTTIEGVIEDVTDIVLNFKQLRFKRQIQDVTSETAIVTIGDQEVFKASDINKFLNSFQILNPDFEICHLNPNVKMTIELTIDKGRGYVPAEDNKILHNGHGIIAIDSIHTPIRNVKYTIDNWRVEQKTDFEKLSIEIDTDGSITPKEAIKDAAKILIQHFILFSDEKIMIDFDEHKDHDEFDENMLHTRQLLKTKLTELDLSVRALNCLKAAYIETLGELVSYQKSDLLKFRNFGKKSLVELEDLVKAKGFEFGMKLDMYKLDKD